MAASIEEVGAMTESLAASVDQNSSSIEQMSRSIQSVADSGRRIGEVVTGASTSALQMERSTQAVATLAKQADEITRRVGRDAEEGGAAVQKSMQGIGRLRDSMVQSATVMREMGKRTNEISTIVDTINLIAERTNLLSLNASIEAAAPAMPGAASRWSRRNPQPRRPLGEGHRRTSPRSSRPFRKWPGRRDGLQRRPSRRRRQHCARPRPARRGSRRSWPASAKITTVVGEVARGTSEQRQAAQSVVGAVSATAEQARLVATATAEQAKGAGQIVQATGQMRRIARK
jgi:methyl-accepting chemotaxis protein